MLEDSKLLGIARIPKKYDDRPKCSNCKNYKLYPPDPVLIYSRPKHYCTAIKDLVTDSTIETDCYAMRRIWAECGPSAELFDPKPPDDVGTPEPPSPVDPGMRGVWKALFGLLGALAILALAFWLAYEYDKEQHRVIQTGQVSVKTESLKGGSCCVTARTRLLVSGNR